MKGLELRAPAKVNLVLRVLEREASGYHRIETLLCGITLCDRIRVEERATPGVDIQIRSPWNLGPEEENLAVRAARAFLDRVGREHHGVALHLEKEVPPGSGLGGGSSDAAAVLRAMNRLHGAPLAEEELLRLGSGLGSDVPFFLGASPLALARGRGDRLTPLAALPPRPLLLVLPPFGVSTTDAYRRLARDRREVGGPSPSGILKAEDGGSWEGVAGSAENDFERILFELHPELARMRDALSASGAEPALLTGSGSALFGVFRDAGALERARSSLETAEGWSLLASRTLERWPGVEEK
ncbi:MAG: 4-(cytidine 5'-diphospho)-2-C-methyl-D-erythritol kinase [Gemmatimonadetes bacterium]|nr:4-(cytidine 5'-diphospho)-2-C-methyl-D-erythritol kinase [Gemmatimonadota bacterium]NIR80078.1 4-(cytidine 5'-diphospho)-2-C-methyl-D-erythritol kinase [Gemmatimonadota bacterium]NIT88816.1 4-(cytidine 5'-diphospho)-2-C-methyl-D-erythritol kinase [Gemmatimonadota bacterium]NIU32620.1 4-(cytidine 5'-diphospho)-2-C-methyl-D-erythritol kinase [Gemmatimonadota bacterium]NIU37073.1 4-(cytidine 5'-diphospho)-2-C-methyl-D-erythritol kinase [Gemmatimonadota bacterium]